MSGDIERLIVAYIAYRMTQEDVNNECSMMGWSTDKWRELIFEELIPLSVDLFAAEFDDTEDIRAWELEQREKEGLSENSGK